MPSPNLYADVFVATSQPMTRYTDPHLPGKRLWVTLPDRHVTYTDCCGKRRWAKYVRVRVYYDYTYRFCADGHGCHARRGAR